MSCDLCMQNSHPCQLNHHPTYESQYYSEVPAAAATLEDEPVAPALSLGNRILWLTESNAASGIVRWIGRIPSISTNWSAGIEFDNVMPGGGNGNFQGRIFFHSRPGHSLFLPVADLLKVDEPTANTSGERTSFFGRLQDTCSNFAHRRRRDSTFGHFKQECYSSYAHDLPHNGHFYSHAPVYDRITSRRSLHYEEQPYETYNTCMPCSSVQSSFNHPLGNAQNYRVCNNNPIPFPREDCSRHPDGRTLDRIGSSDYSEKEFPALRMTRRESIFNPRSTLRFISGFKEWVSCLVLGTNRRKSKNKIVLKDRKSVTSVFLSNNSQSVTGQRLSSFSEYASINLSGENQRNEKSTLKSIKESNNSVDNSKRVTRVKIRSRKKRPAPLPPTELANSNKNENIAVLVNGNINSASKTRELKTENRSKIVTKTITRSTSFIARSAPSKKRYKKRRAPPPPVINTKTTSAIYASVSKKDKKIAQNSFASTSTKHDDGSFPSIKKKHNSIILHDVNGQDYESLKFEKSKHKPTHQQLCRLNALSFIDNSSNEFVESGSEDSSSGSISFSPEESPDDKYGLVKYRMAKAIDSNKGDLPASVSSNFIQYADDNSDVCLKISIQKTETNVVTVEEVPAPHTTHYMIDEDTSSSELSDEPPVTRKALNPATRIQEHNVNNSSDNSDDSQLPPVPLKAIKDSTKIDNKTDSSVSLEDSQLSQVPRKAIKNTANIRNSNANDSPELSHESQVSHLLKNSVDGFPNSKSSTTDSSSVSQEEETNDKSKTIFEELQIQPPSKGSVKDFVNAFNMLAVKSTGVGQWGANSVSGYQVAKNSKMSAQVKGDPKSIQSFPTKWEFQNSNKNPNLVFSSNQFLLPIAEESHNEASEHDERNSKHSSPDKLKYEKKELLSNHKIASQEKAIEISEDVKKKCSHCSEKHSSLKDNVSSKSPTKRSAPRLEKVIHNEFLQPQKSNMVSSQASTAALSSLLYEKDQMKRKEVRANTSKQNQKLDQPIMVGLYIEDKSSHRGPIPLLVTPSTSLKKLKKQVEAEYNFPRHQQCWILGESFAVQEDASLASYGVIEAGCPILLYVMTRESKSHSLPSRTCNRIQSQEVHNSSDSSEEEVKTPRHHKRSLRKQKLNFQKEISSNERQSSAYKEIHSYERRPFGKEVNFNDKKLSDRRLKNSDEGPLSGCNVLASNSSQKDSVIKKIKSEYHKQWEKEYEKKADYHTLVALDDVDLVANMEEFECPICFLNVNPEEGAVLQDCLHSFCRECLASSIQYSDTAQIRCPFRNNEYSCESHLQEREIKSLVTPAVYEKHLARSMALAESQAQDSFHCKTPDCPGWCLYEDNVNTFQCPVCKHTNCLTCAAVHEGKNCRQYQDGLAFMCDKSEEAKKTKEYLQNMVQNGEAMECPQCQVILMKKWGCDWLKCSMCHTEVCWVTKGPRWGPAGRGDTSGGCKCMLNGVRCHPKCSYCH